MSARFVPSARHPGRHGPNSTWVLVSDGGVLVRLEDATLPTGEVARGVAEGGAVHYLGTLDGRDCFAAWVDDPPPNHEPRGLRSLYGVLDEGAFGVAGRAVQVVDWDRTHRFCGRCGTPTETDGAERAKRCPSCGLTAYPRLAPATITLVRRGEEALLARGTRFPGAFYSTLAGFVEPGESLEECVAREVREEVGVEVDRIRYFGSQPWPFPHSLMIGFTARYAGGEIVPEPDEIADAGWFTVESMPPVAPPMSIARRLIDAWVGEVRGPA